MSQFLLLATKNLQLVWSAHLWGWLNIRKLQVEPGGEGQLGVQGRPQLIRACTCWVSGCPDAEKRVEWGAGAAGSTYLPGGGTHLCTGAWTRHSPALLAIPQRGFPGCEGGAQRPSRCNPLPAPCQPSSSHPSSSPADVPSSISPSSIHFPPYPWPALRSCA